MAENALGDLMPDISRLIESKMGLHYPPERWLDLQRGLQAAGSELGFSNVVEFAHRLLCAPLTQSRVEALAGALTVGETFFFRDRATFTALEHDILPALIASRRTGNKHLRLWSAGCCTGEEPYSLAMLIARLLPDREDWRVTILATDINPRFLQKAEEGVFAEWSFRDVPPWLKQRYFTSTPDGRFAILPHIKQMVTFRTLNLAEDVYPSLVNGTHAMDVIFCRNVLIYLSPAQTKKVVGNFLKCLVPGGWLSVSATEASSVLFQDFATVSLPGVTFYRKHSLANVVRDSAASPTLTGQGESPLDSPLPFPSQAFSEQNQEQQKRQEPPEREGDSPPSFSAEESLVLARLSADRGDLAMAQKWCEAAISTDKLNPMGYYLRAMILQEGGNTEEAIQTLKQTLYLKPDLVTAHFALGSLTKQQGRHKEAEKHLDNALHLLQFSQPEDILPQSEGIAVGRLTEMIHELKKDKSA